MLIHHRIHHGTASPFRAHSSGSAFCRSQLPHVAKAKADTGAPVLGSSSGGVRGLAIHSQRAPSVSASGWAASTRCWGMPVSSVQKDDSRGLCARGTQPG